MRSVFVVIRRVGNDITENHGIFSTYELAKEFADGWKEHETELIITEVELNRETIF